MNIVEFLRARYAEARDRQMRTFRDTWEPGSTCPVCERPTESMSRYGGSLSLGPLASFKPCRHEVNDPALLTRFEEPNPDPEVLADLDAKVGILDWFDAAGSSPELHSDAWQIMRQVVLLLGVPFAAHPDYDERWRP
jgi:hypothetical protein